MSFLLRTGFLEMMPSERERGGEMERGEGERERWREREEERDDFLIIFLNDTSASTLAV